MWCPSCHAMPSRPITELRGRAGAEPGYTWQDEVDGLSAVLPADRPTHLVGLSAGAGAWHYRLRGSAPGPGREPFAGRARMVPSCRCTTVERRLLRGKLDAILRLPATEARDGFRRLIVRTDVPLPDVRSDIGRARARPAIEAVSRRPCER